MLVFSVLPYAQHEIGGRAADRSSTDMAIRNGDDGVDEIIAVLKHHFGVRPQRFAQEPDQPDVLSKLMWIGLQIFPPLACV